MIGNAIKIAKIATGEEAEDLPPDGKSLAAKELGAKVGNERAEKLSPEPHAEIASWKVSAADPAFARGSDA